MLERGDSGRGTMQGGVLIPSRCEPIGRDCHRQRTANHKPEITATGHGRRRRRTDVIEAPQYRVRRLRVLRQWLVQGSQAINRRRRRRNRPRGQFVEIPRSAGCRIVQEIVHCLKQLR